MIEKDVWEDCYEEGWRKLIVPEAFCHPAKFSRNLIERIYIHAIDNGWIKNGDFVLDPFGGVALGALDAITRGVNWIGVELEEKFVKLGEENIDKWKQDRKVKGTARIIQGDSRNLKARLIGTPDLVVSSPPYADIWSPKEGGEIKQEWGKHRAKRTKGNFSYNPDNKRNLSNMKEGDFDLASFNSTTYREQRKIDRKNKTLEGYNKENKDNLGSISCDTFWEASREIIQGCFDLLKPGGHAIWVIKDYVRDKKRVPFSDMWTSLCESVGFKVVCLHYAMLIKGDQMTMDNGVLGSSKIKTERKSFFRRLQEKKGSPRIDWEDVVCMVK